jgi:hypothetical protein
MKSKNNIDFGYLTQRAATRTFASKNAKKTKKNFGVSDISSCIFDKASKHHQEQVSEAMSNTSS